MNRSFAAHAIKVLPLLLSVAVIAVMGQIFAGRLAYPYDLEWMEGGMLVHSWRMMHGLPVYQAPAPDFIPYIYPPGYPALLALLGQVFPLDYTLGRTVSVLGTLAAASAMAFGLARQGSRYIGFAMAAMFLGCFHQTGKFYDLVRPDGLLVGLLACCPVLGLERSKGAVRACGLLLFLAFTVKHNAALLGLPLLAAIALRDGKSSAGRFLLWSMLPALSYTALVQWLSDGHFLNYLLSVPAAHPIVGLRSFPGTPIELQKHMPVVLLVLLVWLVMRSRVWLKDVPARWSIGIPAVFTGLIVLRFVEWPGAVMPDITQQGWPLIRDVLFGLGLPAFRNSASGGLWGSLLAAGSVSLGVGLVLTLLVWRPPVVRDWRWVYGVGVAAVSLVMGAVMRGHHGGFVNVLIPLHWVAIFCAGVALIRTLQKNPNSLVRQGLVAAALALQLGLLVQTLDVQRSVPTQADVQAGDALVKQLSEMNGPVLSPFAPWLAKQAGFEPSFHLIALWDVDHPRSPYAGSGAQMRRWIKAGHWQTIVDANRSLRYTMSKHYEVQSSIVPKGGTFYLKSGWRVRPRALMVPKER